ncbi:MAG: ABC transporter permease [bacterium]|nr:ABC transporter permease [bacterium]
MMLFKLSLKNVKKCIKDYSIYFFTLMIAVCIFYVFNSMDSQMAILKLSESKADVIKSLIYILGYISIFISIVLGFLIIYANNFLIKRRKKEMGLYLTLGMSKLKVSSLVVLETLIVGVASLVVGLLAGIVLSQFLSIIIAKMFEVNMESFYFVFSSSSLLKTITYFGIIYVLVILFNVLNISRYKLIDLINADKKNEKAKIKNKYFSFIVFILSLLFLGYGYKLLFDGILFNFDDKTIIMFLSGAIGTFLFFWSISGFFLRIIKLNKKIYLKNLNIFVLKQVNSRINTTVISTSFVALMLMIAISSLSGSVSLANAYNGNFNGNNLSDFTISEYYDNKTALDNNPNIDMLINDEKFNSYVEKYATYNTYYDNAVIIEMMMNEETINDIKNEFNGLALFNSVMPIMSLSDYNKLMQFYGRNDLVVNMNMNNYLLLCNVDSVKEYYYPAIRDGNEVVINGEVLVPYSNEIIDIALENFNGDGNAGILVISDQLIDEKEIFSKKLLGNLIESGNLEIENDFVSYFEDITGGNYINTTTSMRDANIGVSAIATFVGLYLGFVFAIGSAMILAIGQLSESSDNNNRYKLLRQIGADEKMINRSLLMQISICFILPFIVGLVHSFFGLREVNKVIDLVANINLTTNIIVTTLFIILVYGGYFIATYLCSKRIIREK